MHCMCRTYSRIYTSVSPLSFIFSYTICFQFRNIVKNSRGYLSEFFWLSVCMYLLSTLPLPSSVKLSLLTPLCFGPDNFFIYFFNAHLFSERLLKEVEVQVVNHVRTWLKLKNCSTRSYFFRIWVGLAYDYPLILYHVHHISLYIYICSPVMTICLEMPPTSPYKFTWTKEKFTKFLQIQITF